MKITAACAALGAAIGAVLFLALRFVVGDSVLAGIGPGGDAPSGMPRRYADYLPTDVGSSIDVARVLPVVLGTGLIAGLLVGVVWRFVASRRASGPGRSAFAGALVLSGLVVGTLLAVELHAYGRQTDAVGGFGWFAYSPFESDTVVDGVLYGGGPAPSWWPLVLTGAGVGLLVGAVAAIASPVGCSGQFGPVVVAQERPLPHRTDHWRGHAGVTVSTSPSG